METEIAIGDQLLSIVTDPSRWRPPFGEATLGSDPLHRKHRDRNRNKAGPLLSPGYRNPQVGIPDQANVVDRETL